MTPAQITKLLALDIGWRRLLAAAAWPGRWIRPGGWSTGSPLSHVADGPSTPFAGPDAIDLHGWAWAPCDSLAWLACLPPEAWQRCAGLIPNREAVITYCLAYMSTHKPR